MLKVNNWISSRTYKLSESEEIAFIINQKANEFIILKGYSAHVWNMISSACKKADIIKYAKLKEFEDELNSFFSELMLLDLISNGKNNKNKRNNKLSDELNNTDVKEDNKSLSSMNDFLEKNNYLPNLFLELTYNCNLNCVHCYNDKFRRNYFISYKKIKPVIDEAIKLGIFYVTLSGGECTLNKDFLKIAKYIRKNKIALNIFTNGQVLNDDEKLFNELVSIYPFKVYLSLYSMKPEIHDKITRVKGSQLKTLNVIKKLKEKNINVEVKVFLTKINAKEYKDIEKYCNDNKIGCSFDYTLLNNSDLSNADYAITYKQLTNILLDKESVCCVKNLSTADTNKNSRICNGGYNEISINPFYDIYTCPGSKNLLGNCKKESLTKVWFEKDKNNTPLCKIRQLRKKDLKQCYKKDYCNYCHYCLAVASSANLYLQPYERLCKIAETTFNAQKLIEKN